MKIFRSVLGAVATSILVIGLAAPAMSFAHDQEYRYSQFRRISPEAREQWFRNRLDREAAMLEIKSSQQNAWDAYSAASLDVMRAFGERKALPAIADAAATVRQHAEQASVFAQKLSRLADATEKLQSVLNEDQKKVLDRIVSMPRRPHGNMP